MKKYTFNIPVKISYCLNESNITLESIKDLKKLQKKYDVDLQFVIDEYEYKVDIEREALEDDDYVGLSKEEIFDSVITDSWKDIMDKLTIYNELENLEHNEIKIYNKEIENNFNLFLSKTNFPKEYNISYAGFDIQNSNIIINVLSEKLLSDNEYLDLKKLVDDNFIYKWCDVLEELDLAEIVGDEDRIIKVII
jgi:Fe-S cluster biosynthesis and repair protein YggX